MTLELLHEFFNELSHDEMSLMYSGDFSDEVTSKVIGLSNAQFDDGSEMNKLQRKTGFLIAECFQNIVRHNESSIENGYFLTRNDAGDLYIASGNVVPKELTSVLSEKLEHLNSLSKDELKEVYVKTLSNNEISAKGGAGLGLIEMARKTGNKLVYEFEDINDILSYFYFQLKFKTVKSEENEDRHHSLKEGISIRKKMLENNIFLVYQGDISMNTVMPILNMVEKSLESITQELHVQKRVFIALLEFLQNMSKHGEINNDIQHGLLLIGEENGQFLIGGINYVGENDKKQLESKLGEYTGRNHEELNSEYKRVLKEGDPGNTKGSSLGIIEISRRSTSPIQYDFSKTDDGREIVTMLLKI